MKDAARARRRWIGDARRLPHTSPGEDRHNKMLITPQGWEASASSAATLSLIHI